MFNTILLPLDGSELGEAALPYVEELALKAKAEVILLQSVIPPHDTELARLAQDYVIRVTAKAKDYLEDIKTKLNAKGIPAYSEVMIGNPVDTIIDYAKEHNVDLIAISTHGRSGVSRWLFGSVADRVAHRSEKPILLVRPHAIVQE